VAASPTPLPVDQLLPGLLAYACWDGGYVKPFLEALSRHLPPGRYRFLPMYSMSTEAILTVTFAHRTPEGPRLSFAPLGPGVFYEFLPEGMSDAPEHLLGPAALAVGQRYTMVVSDAFGLVRYQTDDLFRCEGFVKGVPDLRFEGRRTLSYSFTGEKLTGAQVQLALAEVLKARPKLQEGSFLTCAPVLPGASAPPRYDLLIAEKWPGAAPADAQALAREVDAALRQVNLEYDAKVRSGRLGPLGVQVMPLRVFVERVQGENGSGLDSPQFKFLPLYPRPLGSA
jgi:hypothetical protein